jgi:hypothetical protein
MSKLPDFNFEITLPNGYIVQARIPEGFNRPNAVVFHDNNGRSYIYKFEQVVDTIALDLEDIEI